MNDDLQKYRKVIMESQEPIANFSFTVGRMYVAMVRNFLEEVTLSTLLTTIFVMICPAIIIGIYSPFNK